MGGERVGGRRILGEFGLCGRFDLARSARRIDKLTDKQHLERALLLPASRAIGPGRLGPAEFDRKAAAMLGQIGMPRPARLQARKSVVEGKSVSVRVDLGGRRNIQKKKN